MCTFTPPSIFLLEIWVVVNNKLLFMMKLDIFTLTDIFKHDKKFKLFHSTKNHTSLWTTEFGEVVMPEVIITTTVDLR